MHKNIGAIIDATLNQDMTNRTHAFILIVCQVDGIHIGGDSRILSNLGDDMVHTLLRDALEQMDIGDTQGSA